MFVKLIKCRDWQLFRSGLWFGVNWADFVAEKVRAECRFQWLVVFDGRTEVHKIALLMSDRDILNVICVLKNFSFFYFSSSSSFFYGLFFKIISSVLHHSVMNSLFSEGIPSKTLYAFLFSPVFATCGTLPTSWICPIMRLLRLPLWPGYLPQHPVQKCPLVYIRPLTWQIKFHAPVKWLEEWQFCVFHHCIFLHSK